jgi:hypothetical protein
MTTSESPIVIEDREELIFLLSEASQLEHMIMCQYLFAAFSLKGENDADLTESQRSAVTRWKKTLYGIAADEMLHLALVANLHTALGAFPHFNRPNFPQHSRWFPAGFNLDLRPFNRATLEHFLFLERPEGVTREDGSDFKVELAVPLAVQITQSGIEPVPQEFATVGHLYRGIENGLRYLVDKYGAAQTFIGPTASQTVGDFFAWPLLIPVTDLASALGAIDTIIAQGEGSGQHAPESHYGKFLTVYNEFRELKQQDPAFEPAYPARIAWAQFPVESKDDLLLITEPLTAGISDLFNSCYQVLLQMLIRFFVHSGENEPQFQVLADCAVNSMFELILPLGELLTRLPISSAYPDLTAGPNFEIFRTGYILPHRHSAWRLMQERLGELGEMATQLAKLSKAPAELNQVVASLRGFASKLASSDALENNSYR